MTSSEHEIDDVLELFIIEADLAGSWLERNVLPHRWRFWRTRLDYSRGSLVLLAPVMKGAVAKPETLELISRRVIQYVGETIMNHGRAFWGRDRESGAFQLLVHRQDAAIVTIDLAGVTSALLTVSKGGTQAGAELLLSTFDDAVTGSAPPVGVR